MKKILMIIALFIVTVQAKSQVRLDVVVDPALCGQTFEATLEWLDLSTCAWGGNNYVTFADGQTYTYSTGDAWRIEFIGGCTVDLPILLGDPSCSYNNTGSGNVPMTNCNACNGPTALTPFNVALVTIVPGAHYEIRFTP